MSEESDGLIINAHHGKSSIIKMMEKSFNCCVLDASNITSFPFPILSDNDGKFVNINNKRIALDNLTVGYLREFMCPNVDVSIMRELKLWKVNVKKQEIKGNNISTKEDIEQKLHGEEMEPEEPFERYFRNELDNKEFARFNIHIIVQMPPPPPPTTGTGKRPLEDSSSDEESRKKRISTSKTLASLLILQSSTKKIPSVPHHKFYDRDEALNSMLEITRRNYQKRGSYDHKDHNFILIPGGIGIGKTRMGLESQNLKVGHADNIEFKEALGNPCYIFIDLNNGSKYVPGFDCNQSPGIRIGARVALAYGLIPNLHYLLTVNAELFDLSNVVYEILKRKQHSVVAIIIHIDEYQLYIDAVQKHNKNMSWEQAREFFKDMLKEIGGIMRGNMTIKTETGYTNDHGYTNKYFIVPICTGTSAIDLHFLPTEYKNTLLNLGPLSYNSARSMFLDKYEYSRQLTNEGRNLAIQGLKSHYSSNFCDKDIENLSKKFCDFVLNQQHFHIAMFDTGFIPKFIDDLLNPNYLQSDFDWGNSLLTLMSSRSVGVVGKNPGNWKSYDDIRTIISFGLTGQNIKRDFLLPSLTSIGELERSGLIYLSKSNGDWHTIVMPFILLKILNRILLISQLELSVFPDNLLLIPTHDSPWEWQHFESLYGYYQKTLIDSLICIQESRVKSIYYKIEELKVKGEQKNGLERIKINQEIASLNEELTNEKSMNWQLSDLFRGAYGADSLLQHKLRLHKLKVFTEKKKFLESTTDVAIFNDSVLCDDDLTRPLNEGIFRCYKGCANIDHRWVLNSENGKNLAIFSQIKYSERGASTRISATQIKSWYKTTMKSVRNYKDKYNVILVLFMNRKCTGQINIEKMPELLLICPENIEKYLSPTFAHRGLIDKPSEK